MVNFPEISIFLILIGNTRQTCHKRPASLPNHSFLMNIRSFVGASSAVLLAWLGATYFHELPPERYQLDRTLGPTAAQPAASDEATTDLAATDL